jgi:hypothetical protein
METIRPIRVEGSKIERIPPPVTVEISAPLVQGIQVPVVDVPVPRLEYPRIEVPRQENFDKNVPDKTSESKEEKPEKTRELSTPSPPPVRPPSLPVAIPQVPQTPSVLVTPEQEKFAIEIAGQSIDLPAPAEAVQAGATAIVGTSATLVTALVFNQARQAVTPVVQKLARDKFKIKLKVVKPVLHFVEEQGEVRAIEYSAEGVRLVSNKIENPEQYLRDLINTDPLFESDHRIVIDEPIKDRFTREGADRFKYFVSPKKMAKKLAARFTI